MVVVVLLARVQSPGNHGGARLRLKGVPGRARVLIDLTGDRLRGLPQVPAKLSEGV